MLPACVGLSSSHDCTTLYLLFMTCTTSYTTCTVIIIFVNYVN